MNKTLVMRNHLFQLPKSEDYFGYSDENGIIYFIHSDAEKSITKYHKSFSNLGHKTVAKSKRKEGPGHLTSVSKKLGQRAVVIHYCALS